MTNSDDTTIQIRFQALHDIKNQLVRSTNNPILLPHPTYDNLVSFSVWSQILKVMQVSYQIEARMEDCVWDGIEYCME